MVIVPIYIPTNKKWGFPFLHILSSICYLYTYYSGHSNWYEVVSHGTFDLHFFDKYWCWKFFHVPVGRPYVFFGELSILVYCLFFNWVFFLFVCFLFFLLLLSFISCFYILEIKPFSVASFPIIFSHSVGCLFIFVLDFYGFFCCAKLLNLIRAHFFIFVFISIALGDWPKKTFVRFCLCLENVLPMFSSRSLMVVLSYVFLCLSL